MLSLIMNECNSWKCAPWTEEETPKSSRAPEGIRLWQTTSPVSASTKKGEGVIFSPGITELLGPSGRFWFPNSEKRSMSSDAAGYLSAFSTFITYCTQRSVRGYCRLWQWRIMIKQTVFKALAHSCSKRSNIKKQLNEWHWQMLSVLVGALLPVVSRGAGGSG